MKRFNVTHYYQVCTGVSSYLAIDGYSKYYDRYKMAERGEIKRTEVYGIDQCNEHIKEYFEKTEAYYKKQGYDHKTIETPWIERITQVTEVIEPGAAEFNVTVTTGDNYKLKIELA